MRRTYTTSELRQFLTLLDLPPEEYLNLNVHPNNPNNDDNESHKSPPPSPPAAPDVNLLRTLNTHMISTIPYETLALQYSATRKIQLSPQHLFDKIVSSERGRGGYCLENNLFYSFVLRDLGFRVYPVGAKSRLRRDGVPRGDFQGWGHIVLIVTLSDESRWAVDVCFGGDGPTQPMQLVEGSVIRNMGTQDARLIRDFIPGQTSRAPEHKMWQYQYRNDETQPWQTFYSFSDAVEWLPSDFNVVNYFTGSSPESSSLATICVVKFLRRPVTVDEADNVGTEGKRRQQEIFGKRMLVNELVKENLGGKTKVVQECRSEEERIQALRHWFGVELTQEEKDAMKDHPLEIRISR